MAAMRDFAAEAEAKVAADARAAGHWAGSLFHREHDTSGEPVPSFTPAAQPAQPVQQSPAQPEVHQMSPILADAQKAAQALVKHIGTLLGNPLVDAVIEAGAGAFLGPEEVAHVVAIVQAIETARAANKPDPLAQFAQSAPLPAPADGTTAQPAAGVARASGIQ